MAKKSHAVNDLGDPSANETRNCANQTRACANKTRLRRERDTAALQSVEISYVPGKTGPRAKHGATCSGKRERNTEQGSKLGHIALFLA